MPNAEKVSAVAELTEHFRSSSAAVITEYRGLTVKQVSELRRTLGNQTTYAVVKNTLTKRAVADAGLDVDEALLTGPTAIAFVGGDPVEAAKGLRDFAKANPLLVIKGGLMDGKALSVSEVNRIADLESREVLLAKLAGALKALPTRAASLFQAPLSQMARLAAALEEKKPAAAVAPEDSSDTAAPDAAPAEDVASDVVADEVVAPEVVAPEVVAPEVVAPEVVAPEVVAPEVVAPEVAVVPAPAADDVAGADAVSAEAPPAEAPAADATAEAPAADATAEAPAAEATATETPAEPAE